MSTCTQHRDLFTKTALDNIQNLCMRWVCLIKDVLQCKIQCAEEVSEVLREDPTTISGQGCVCGW